jgi:prefoldin subunit 5
MSMLVQSLKRRNEALSAECDALARAIDNLSVQLEEVYRVLQQHDPAYVAAKTGIAVPVQPPLANGLEGVV